MPCAGWGSWNTGSHGCEWSLSASEREPDSPVWCSRPQWYPMSSGAWCLPQKLAGWEHWYLLQVRQTTILTAPQSPCLRVGPDRVRSLGAVHVFRYALWLPIIARTRESCWQASLQLSFSLFSYSFSDQRTTKLFCSTNSLNSHYRKNLFTLSCGLIIIAPLDIIIHTGTPTSMLWIRDVVWTSYVLRHNITVTASLDVPNTNVMCFWS